jgi:DNA ligase D-like protein (predicted ligase)
MLAFPAAPFDSDDHLFEVKWDGIRALAYLDGKTKLISRQNRDLSPRYPELEGIHRRFGDKAVVDGEIVCFVDGKPSFYWLQRRNLRGAATYPAVYIVFDLLYYGNKDVCQLPLIERKGLLQRSLDPGENVALSGFILARGIDYYRAAKDHGLEGIMAKDIESPYLSGRRSRSWLKIKVRQVINSAIGGYLTTNGALKSLLLGAKDVDGLRYIGAVGSGFTEGERMDLAQRLAKLSIPSPVLLDVPLDVAQRARWTEPELTCRVEYLELTPEGLLRHATYKGLTHAPCDPLPRR